jgi:hypothetical protein
VLGLVVEQVVVVRLAEVRGPDRRVVDGPVRLRDLIVERTWRTEMRRMSGVVSGVACLVPNCPRTEDLVFTLEREFDILALGDLDDLVRADGLRLALEDLVEGLLLECRLLLASAPGRLSFWCALPSALPWGEAAPTGAARDRAIAPAVTSTANLLMFNACSP